MNVQFHILFLARYLCRLLGNVDEGIFFLREASATFPLYDTYVRKLLQMKNYYSTECISHAHRDHLKFIC